MQYRSKIINIFQKFPVIDLGNVKLRELQLKDKENYYKVLNDPLVSQFLSDEDIPHTLDAALESIKLWGSLFYRKSSLFWAIANSHDDQLIGSIGFCSWNFHNHRGEISYELLSSFWNKGIMSKVLGSILKFGFLNMELFRIEARTMTNNIVSQHLLNKMGFQKEGLLKSYRLIRGQPTDIDLFSLVKADYPNYQA